MYRRSDETFFWQHIDAQDIVPHRKLSFNKSRDVLDRSAADAIAQLTVPKIGFGYYVPPLGEGEEAIVNMLPIKMPDEIYVASTSFSSQQAMAILFDEDEPPRFDWAIKGRSFWSFHDPRMAVTSAVVDEDQVEAIDVSELAFHEDFNEQANFAFLLRQILRHEFDKELGWVKDRKLFYFRADAENTAKVFQYRSAKNRTEAEIVNVSRPKDDPDRVAFVRHHAFIPRFELILDQWYLIMTPTYHFTTNGFIPHSYPHALLSGKKRLDNNASLRGQVIMWHKFLSRDDAPLNDLFEAPASEQQLRFGAPAEVTLPTTVPEDAWRRKKPAASQTSADQGAFELE